MDAQFPLGQTYVDGGTANLLKTGFNLNAHLHRHESGDYGELTSQDELEANQHTLTIEKGLIKSRYQISKENVLEIVTEIAQGRSCTRVTFLEKVSASEYVQRLTKAAGQGNAEALDLLRKAAEQGSKEAQQKLAAIEALEQKQQPLQHQGNALGLFINGLSRVKDDPEGRYEPGMPFFEKALESGLAKVNFFAYLEAMRIVGSYYFAKGDHKTSRHVLEELLAAGKESTLTTNGEKININFWKKLKEGYFNSPDAPVFTIEIGEGILYNGQICSPTFYAKLIEMINFLYYKQEDEQEISRQGVEYIQSKLELCPDSCVLHCLLAKAYVLSVADQSFDNASCRKAVKNILQEHKMAIQLALQFPSTHINVGESIIKFAQNAITKMKTVVEKYAFSRELLAENGDGKYEHLRLTDDEQTFLQFVKNFEIPGVVEQQQPVASQNSTGCLVVVALIASMTFSTLLALFVAM
ncbi:MAG: hypothetical protein LiPW30_788 [Parcubacteria group bacterium LiPW_30]|nr:MAG: hypothetical protein LiPW30_788 [Parcubacteria group bacterium LiPW_30]